MNFYRLDEISISFDSTGRDDGIRFSKRVMVVVAVSPRLLYLTLLLANKFGTL